jgi:fatty-acyl-CoA synthase/O-succinylbenzoic acid--CoA ligase
MDLLSTTQYLALHARRQPEAVAIVRQGESLSYRQLADRVVQHVRALQELRIGSGTVVGIACDNALVHLLLLLACGNLGAATASLVRSDLQPDNPLYRRCDEVLADAGLELPTGPRAHVVTPRWLAKVESTTPHRGDWAMLDAAPDPRGLARITRTSGTAGRPKLMAVSYALTRELIAQYGSHPSEHIPSPLRFILIYTMAARFACNRTFMCLQGGGTIILSDRRSLIADIERHGANYAVILVGDAERAVAQLPAEFQKPALFSVVPIGAGVSATLRKSLLDKLATHVVDVYTSNETGRICVNDADGVGTVHPGVAVAIVDEHGRELPHGETGRIKVRSPTMVDGYLDDPALTAATFIDGWFHTGDLGVTPAPGRLVVLGRADDMLNIGGLKVAPGPIEDELKAIAGVRDAAAVAVANVLGGAAFGFAVEIAAGIDPNRLRAAITKTMQSKYPRFHLMFVTALPRTETGKIRRNAVADLFRQRLSATSSVPLAKRSFPSP